MCCLFVCFFVRALIALFHLGPSGEWHRSLFCSNKQINKQANKQTNKQTPDWLLVWLVACFFLWSRSFTLFVCLVGWLVGLIGVLCMCVCRLLRRRHYDNKTKATGSSVDSRRASTPLPLEIALFVCVRFCAFLCVCVCLFVCLFACQLVCLFAQLAGW